MRTLRFIERSTLVLALPVVVGSCSAGSLVDSHGTDSSNQTWVLDFGPDPVVAGREETAKVIVSSFTNSGTFSETADSPGVYIYDPTGACHYRLTIGGTVSHAGQNDNWTFVGITGAGCGMQTLGSGGGTANGAFPAATAVGGTLTVTTQSPLGTSHLSGNWTGHRQ